MLQSFGKIIVTPEINPFFFTSSNTLLSKTMAIPFKETEKEGSDSITWEIERLFKLLDNELKVKIAYPNMIREYLMQYPGIIEIIRIASIKTRYEFGTEAKLKLEMYVDPEEDDFVYPLLNVCLRDYPPDVLKQLEEIEDLYLDQLKESRGWFLLTTDFGPYEDVIF